MSSCRLAPLLLASTLFGSACAFTDIPLTLPTRGLENTVQGGRGRQVIVQIPFADRRQMQRCGMKKNGYNADTADATCDVDPDLWIARLLADELRASGFDVLTEPGGQRPGALRLEGDLLKIFVEPVIGFWSGSLEADLSVELRASTETGLAAERTFFVKGWKGGAMLGTPQPYLTALHRATQAMLEEMVRAILELMDRYPQLGSQGTPLRLLATHAEARS